MWATKTSTILAWCTGFRKRTQNSAFWTTCWVWLPVTVEFTAGQLRRPAENIEHGRLNAAMRRSAITRNNVGRIAQETDRVAPPAAETERNIVSRLVENIKRLTLTRATAVTAVFREALRCRERESLSRAGRWLRSIGIRRFIDGQPLWKHCTNLIIENL